MGLTHWLPSYFNAFTIEKGALDITTESKRTPEMAEKDHERDEDYRGFVSAVKANLHHFDQEMRNAAKRLMSTFKHYGDITQKRYAEESAAIEDLLREIDESEELTRDIATLKVGDWRDRLEALNEAFRSLRDQRVDETRMKDARKETDRHYQNIVMHLEYMVKACKATPELTAFITDLNALIKSYKDVLAHGKKKTHKPEEGEKSES